MTDYFALLDQPRRPWLDPERLKETFHARTLQAHPDSAAGDDAKFTELNEAYQVLRDPKRRLQHLLQLGGAATSTSVIPPDIAQLFPEVAALTREAGQINAEVAKTISALSRSLLKTRAVFHRARETALVSLKAIAPEDWFALQTLSANFAYLDRWISELEERELQLEL